MGRCAHRHRIFEDRLVERIGRDGVPHRGSGHQVLGAQGAHFCHCVSEWSSSTTLLSYRSGEVVDEALVEPRSRAEVLGRSPSAEARDEKLSAAFYDWTMAELQKKGSQS